MTAADPAPRRGTVIRLTDEQVVASVRDLVARLRELTGTTDLVDIAYQSLQWELDAAGLAAFDELTMLGFLAGLPHLPCCASHDEDVIEAWAAGVTAILDTGALPVEGS